MSTVRVARCGQCPFQRSYRTLGSAFDEHECAHPERPRDVDSREAEPDWCPLRQGSTTVELALDTNTGDHR